ncbi:hypothetical protein GCM10027341_26890 [Spirosoma knui]
MPRFDTYPVIYWLITYGLCWGVVWVSSRLRISSRLFIASALGLLFLLRLPSIVYNYEINPDESQIITQALTLRHDPVYFRAVDGTTGGPLDSYFLILPSLLGLPFDYITAHLTAFGLIAVCLYLLFRTATLWFGEEAARLALLPLVFVLGLTQAGDFLHYNSELVPLALLSASYYLYARLKSERPFSIWRITLIGLLLGMVPFGKLQAAPMAAVIGLFTLLTVFRATRLHTSEKLGRAAILIGSSLLFPAIFTGLTWLNKVYDDFVTFYLVGNLRYASDTNQLQSILRLPEFFRNGESFDWFIKLSLLVWIVGAVYALRHANGRSKAERNRAGGWQRIGFCVTLLMATIFAITRTGSEYIHYLFFLTGPLVFGAAYGWSQLPQSVLSGRWVGAGILGAFLILFAVQVVVRHRQAIPLNRYPSEWQNGWAVQPSPVSKAIANYAQPGEKLVVWGWRCDYYVQTQMPQGVAENHTIRSGFKHPMQAIYQKRYVRDFVRSFPPVFVDAVGSRNLWMTDRKTQGHEIIKPLGKFIAAHYRYVGLVDDTRLYVRRDRIRPSPLNTEHPLAKK